MAKFATVPFIPFVSFSGQLNYFFTFNKMLVNLENGLLKNSSRTERFGV